MERHNFTPLENETVVYEAKVGKRIFGVYCLLFAILLFIGSVLIIAGVVAWKKGMGSKVIFWGIGVIALCLPFFLHYRSVRKRRYILTDKRIVILRGGIIKKSYRTLSLVSIHGVEKNENFIYNWFGLATIDFYAMAAGSNSTKLKLLSFSSTHFKFQWVDKGDAEKVYNLMQYFVVNGTFPDGNRE